MQLTPVLVLGGGGVKMTPGYHSKVWKILDHDLINISGNVYI